MSLSFASLLERVSAIRSRAVRSAQYSKVAPRIVGVIISTVMCTACRAPLPPGAETDAALATAKWLEESYGAQRSPVVQNELRHIIDRLANADLGRALEHPVESALPLGDRPEHWDAIVIEAREPNAFSLGAGILVLTEGLLLECHSEAELAAVLSHEMAHQILGHTREALNELTNAQLASRPVPATRHSLEEELAADELGLKMLRVARYDVSHALSALELGSRGVQTDMPPEWLTQRAARLSQAIDEGGRQFPATGNTRSFTHMQRSLLGLS